MSKNIRIIYLYSVSFIAIIMMVCGFVSAVNNTATYAFPTSYVSESYTNNNYNRLLKYQQENDRTESTKGIINSIAVIAVGVPLYLYHFKQIEKDKKEKEA